MKQKQKYIEAYIRWATVEQKSDDYTLTDAMLDLRVEMLNSGYMPIDIERLHRDADRLIEAEVLPDDGERS